MIYVCVCAFGTTVCCAEMAKLMISRFGYRLKWPKKQVIRLGSRCPREGSLL